MEPCMNRNSVLFGLLGFFAPLLSLSTTNAAPVTVSYTGPAVAIPDNNSLGININIPVAGVGVISDLNFRFDTAGACDATVGNTNAAVTHTFVGDLTFRLTSPTGTMVSFMVRRGGTRENICLTTIDDDGGAPSLATITSTTGAPVAGNFSPEASGLLSGFDGQNANGTWILNVSDSAGVDTGSVRRFSLIFEPVPTCDSIICPADLMTNTAAGTCSRVVSYAAPLGSGTCGTITCTSPSGAAFPLGTSTVSCQTSVGNLSCSFQVQINDAEPPAISCPGELAVSTVSSFGAALDFAAPSASDNCPGMSPLQCSHAPGEIFPVGETSINCSTTDANGNPASCTFAAKVSGNVSIDSLPGDPPVCVGGAKIRSAKLVLKNIGGALPGGQTARLRGKVRFRPEVFGQINGQLNGAQVQVADLGNSKTALLEYSARTESIDAGGVGSPTACGTDDGWISPIAYKNSSNKLGSPTCISSSANGIKALTLGSPKKKSRISKLSFIFEGSRLLQSAVNGPLSTVVVFGSNVQGSVGQCASATFTASRCKRKGSTLICRN